MPSEIVIEEPNDKQREFFLARERYVAYGGARGGGKSWAVRKKAQLMALKYGGIKILILRRTFPELRTNHILPLVADLQNVARYKEVDKTIYFPNGSMIIFGYCDTDKDVGHYQGQEYDVIFMDEATHFTEYMFDTLKVCVRGANDFPRRFYLTCNPGGVGHEWVKRLFITRQYRASERPEDYQFIKALVYDNKVLMEKDPEYVRQLENLPDGLREAWLEGSWDVFAGQYFPEFDARVHTCEPFAIPAHWRIYRTLDYGLDMLACYWIALDEDGNGYVYRELYEGRDNHMGANGNGHIISEAAERIKELSDDGEQPWLTLAPPDLWNRRQETGQSAADIFAANGVTLTKTSNDRLDGWSAVKEWLRVYVDVDGSKRARLRIFNTCKNLIRTLQAVQHDDKKINDVATEPHELTHAPDALRHFCVYWTYASDREQSVKRVKWPDDLWEDYYNSDEAGRAAMIERFGSPFP